MPRVESSGKGTFSLLEKARRVPLVRSEGDQEKLDAKPRTD